MNRSHKRHPATNIPKEVMLIHRLNLRRSS
ncbi:hypothetical protein IMZ48_01555 [Candidatus Bathyarchaeota archaeon]|nr:hypothetical protein [Candidatus Bathyarchaeota archaeon]